MMRIAVLVLLAANDAEAQGLRERLWRVGIDDVAGYVTGFGDLPTLAVSRSQGLPIVAIAAVK